MPSSRAQPVSLVIHDRLMPGSAIANHLVDRGWRVHTLSAADGLLEQMSRHRPMLIVVQLDLRGSNICQLIREIRADVDLAHIAVLGYGPLTNTLLQNGAIEAGAQVVAADSSILDQLSSLIEKALALD